MLPSKGTIHWLVLSHSDSDHIGGAVGILASHPVGTVLHTGQKRESSIAIQTDSAIESAVTQGTTEINLGLKPITPGTSWSLGKAVITFISGARTPPAKWGQMTESAAINATSIVLRVEYAGRSILLPGDCTFDTEREMLEVAPSLLDCDVLIVPYHGSDSACGEDFLRVATPNWVVFSSGHAFGHPRRTTVERCSQPGFRKWRSFGPISVTMRAETSGRQEGFSATTTLLEMTTFCFSSRHREVCGRVTCGHGPDATHDALRSEDHRRGPNEKRACRLH